MAWKCAYMGVVFFFNTLRPRQDGRYFADDVLKCIFLNENVWISLKIPLKFVPRGPINNIPALLQIMAWRRPGDKPLSEPMMVSLLTHICVTRPQWVNVLNYLSKTLKNVHATFLYWNGADSWNSFTMKTMICLCHRIRTIISNALGLLLLT